MSQRRQIILAEIYISLKEAAQLEGVKYNTLVQKINRNADDYIVKTEPSENGGKDKTLVLLSTLSTKAIRAYQTKQSLEIRSFIENESKDSDDEAWYVGLDLNWYIHNYAKKFYQMVELSKRIEEYLQYDGSDKTNFTNEFAARLGMSGRNFRRKVDKYLEGKAWAIELNELDGKNYDFYKVLALCSPPRKMGNISLTDEMKACIENIWFDDMFAANHRKQKKAYEIFQDIAEKKKWAYVPSYQTVNRYINTLNKDYANERFLADQGMREFKRKKMLKRRRNTGMLRVMELVQGDAHTFDCWVKLERENGYVTAIKPYLVGLIDVKSRCLVGWAICEIPNSQVIKQAMLNMMYPKKNNPIEGVPRILLIDNGKDWTSKALTGRPRTERFSLDGEIKGFYKSIGIEDDMRSLPYQAWSKGQIERFFETLCDDFTSRFDSYTGTLTGSKTIGKIKKDIKKMLKNDELYTIEEFADLFDNWLNEEYHTDTHRGLKEQKEKMPIPIEVFKNAERYYKAAPPYDFAIMQLMKCEERTVYSVGISLFKRCYQNEALGQFEGQKVDVRYDPYDIRKIHVYKKDGTKICEAEYFEGLNPIADKDDEVLLQHIKEQKRQIKNTKARLKNLQTPYDERIGIVDDRKVLLPELTGQIQKVISLPDDKQYRDEVKQNAKSKEQEVNEFYNRQAEKALAAIRKFEKAEGEY